MVSATIPLPPCPHLSWDACATQKAWMYLHKGATRLSLARISHPLAIVMCYLHELCCLRSLGAGSSCIVELQGAGAVETLPPTESLFLHRIISSHPRVPSLLSGFASTLALFSEAFDPISLPAHTQHVQRMSIEECIHNDYKDIVKSGEGDSGQFYKLPRV
jgi:hypothetical protein